MNMSQGKIWVCMVIVIIAVISAICYTNTTLRTIEKNLPNTLLTELNSLSTVLEEVSNIVTSARIAASTQGPANFEQLQENIDVVYHSIHELRDTYVINNIVNASAFHAVIAPAIADLQIWLSEGISGYEPNSPVTLNIVAARISEAYQKASQQKQESYAKAQSILDIQMESLDEFQTSVTVLFVLTLVVVCCSVFLLINQSIQYNKEIAIRDELREEHNLFERLLDNLPLGIAVWDRDKNIVHLNNSFTDITGYSRHDMPHLEKWPHLAYPDPSYRQQVGQHWKEAYSQGVTCEYNVTCKSGEIKNIEFGAIFLPDFRTINTLADVTERNKKERALRTGRKIEERSKKMEFMGLLAGGVAHDLNNILSGIVSYPDLILMELAADDKLRGSIETIRESGKKAAAITQDLLTVARGVAIAKEPININSTIEDYLKSPEFILLKQYHPDVVIDVSLAEKLLCIMGSQVHIRKCIMNLVSNGCEAIKEKGRVFVKTANCYIDTPVRGYDEVEEGEYVVLSVVDQGTGVSEEDLDRIFEPFYSKKVMGRSGTGLGLAIVWNIVQDHQGYINVLSSDEGTAFNIYFPITRNVQASHESSFDMNEFKGNDKLVLVVDDVSSQREITSKIIEKLGYIVESVSSGEAAVEYVRHNPVDLIIMDMIMDPGINGRETYEKILQINPKQKAIIASGYADTDDVQETLRLGASYFLMKPLTLQKLAVVIHEVLVPGTLES